jgi:hypothetical protein
MATTTLKKIKTIHSEKWIDYKGNEVLVIKSSKRGNVARFQYNGTYCSQGSITGFVAKSFSTKSKWFNPNWWYKKTGWSTDTSKLYFKVNGQIKNQNNLDIFSGKLTQKKINARWKQLSTAATKLATPIDYILKIMFREINRKTGMNLQPDFSNIEYGKHWYEAYLPVKNDKGEKFLITWNNCD